MRTSPVYFVLAIFALAASAQAGLVHRWSFNNGSGSTATAGTTLTDSASNSTATIRGGGASFTGTQLLLPGTTTGNQTPGAISAYLDLPNGIISSKTNLTVEVWATPVSAKTWQRLFDFGRMDLNGNAAAQGVGALPGEILHTATTATGTTSSRDNLMLAVNRGTAANTQKLVGRLDGTPEIGVDSNLTVNPGTQYHWAMTFTDGAGLYAASGGQMKWYLNGVLAGTVDLPFHLADLEDVNNWLGRSQYSGDSTANISYDEFRIHDFAMTAAQVSASGTAGANVSFPAPTVVADAVTLHAGQKVAVAVLANDSGNINANTVTIVTPPQSGTAVPTAGGRVLYTHTTGTPAGDSFTYRVRGGGGLSATATVTMTFAPGLRIASHALNVPATPPGTAYQLTAAFGTLAFTQPVCLRTPPGETQRLFVCEKGGLVKVIPNVTAANPTATTFLTLPVNLPGEPVETLDTGGECGLLGVAFHPNYATNRQFFVFYSVNKAGVRHQRVSRFLTEAGNPNLADPTSERVFLEQPDGANNHNGGDLHFGPDGFLYISVGDEGNQNDYYNNSQRIDKDFFSAILRIDVDRTSPLEPSAHPNPATVAVDGTDPLGPAIPLYQTPPGSGILRAAYSIPANNPFVSATTFNGAAISTTYRRSEIWATGLRNPWRFSFDPVTGKLWCGDVGGNDFEEVDIITSGANYGWAYREGNGNGPKSGSAPGNFNSLHTPPVIAYGHGSGSQQGFSITGGFVYRGSRFPALQGRYFFADHVSGNVWTIPSEAPYGTPVRLLGEGGIAAIHPDPSNGDVLFADYDGNRILRLVTGTTDTYPQKLSETGLFADLTDLAPSPGLLPYTVNLPFWSDHAQKRRWFVIPNTIDDMTWSRDGLWTFPTGQVWVKHFDLPLTRSNPPAPGDPLTPARRLETRLIVKNAGGSYGVSYRWNDAGTEAVLAPDEGVEFDVPLTQNGAPYTQRWRIPSRAECAICHTPQAGHALSSNTRQFNLNHIINGFAGNQIDLLRSAGYFTNTTESPNVLPRHLRPDENGLSGQPNFPVEARVRSYLAVNCSYCHKTGGTAGVSAWDGRPELTLTQTGLINGSAANNGGNPANKLIAVGTPNDDLHSIVLNRVAVTNGFTRMPPLGSSELDQQAIALLAEWIGSPALVGRQTYADWRLAEFLSATSPAGEPTFDADGDGRLNSDEFLALTDPLDGALFLQPQIAASSPNFTLGFTVPANRSWQIETSSDLTAWSLWNIPANQGLPHPGGPVTITAPLTPTPQFFRLRLREN